MNKRANSIQGRPTRPEPSPEQLKDLKLEKRVVAKEGTETAEQATARAKLRSWWQLVYDVRPYSMPRHWVWLVRASG